MVKDLATLGRELSQVIIIDNSPISYYFQPENAVLITTWHSNIKDIELLLMGNLL
jgi:RNA polymerase II subunit A small phosphatase-like protein